MAHFNLFSLIFSKCYLIHLPLLTPLAFHYKTPHFPEQNSAQARDSAVLSIHVLNVAVSVLPDVIHSAYSKTKHNSDVELILFHLK